jgi:hypothetical protein
MTYKQKVLTLSILTALLALILAGAIVFSPERRSVRSNQYAWLDSQVAGQVSKVEFTGKANLDFVKQNGTWFLRYLGGDFPLKGTRIEDLLDSISARSDYAVTGKAESSLEAFGLSEEAASHIVLWGETGEEPLLDLMVGVKDTGGTGVYYRKNGQNEVRIGSGTIADYMNYSRASWYDLRLFPNSENIAAENVLRLTVIAPPDGEIDGDSAEPSEPLVISRNGDSWTVTGIADDELDASKILPYIRSVLDSNGDDFEHYAEDGLEFNAGRILVEFNNAPPCLLRLSEVLPPPPQSTMEGRRSLVTSNASYRYNLQSWTVSMLFRRADYFRREQ